VEHASERSVDLDGDVADRSACLVPGDQRLVLEEQKRDLDGGDPPAQEAGEPRPVDKCSLLGSDPMLWLADVGIKCKVQGSAPPIPNVPALRVH
jgi:hypothetical protein